MNLISKSVSRSLISRSCIYTANVDLKSYIYASQVGFVLKSYIYALDIILTASIDLVYNSCIYTPDVSFIFDFYNINLL